MRHDDGDDAPQPRNAKPGERYCRECGGDGYHVALCGPGVGPEGLQPREVKVTCETCSGDGIDRCADCGESIAVDAPDEAKRCAACIAEQAA